MTRTLFSFRGRIARGDFRYALLLIVSAAVTMFVALDATVGPASTWVLYPPTAWALLAVAVKRHHDLGRSGWWLLLLLIPVLGPAWTALSLGLRRGARGGNRYGAAPDGKTVDYLVVRDVAAGNTIIDDITGLNPVEVRRTVRPTTVAEVRSALAESTGSVSVGGGRFSMGGQTACPGSLHIDMRGLNGVVDFSPEERRIRVQAGIRWCDIQRVLDPHDLSVMIMQTYANFTVGGSLGVNAHGRYVGLGPVIHSVRSIAIVTADGSLMRAGPAENSDVFYGAIGGYGGLGVIVEAELSVVPNTRVALAAKRLAVGEYVAHFDAAVRADPRAVFHNADLYPPRFSRVLSQTWVETTKRATTRDRLMAPRASSRARRYFLWAVSDSPFGKWRREFIFDPILFLRPRVRRRNYEAGYDVAELEPASRAAATYALQEYFVPVGGFDAFVARMAEIVRRHGINLLNVSIRHSRPDLGSLLAWARDDVFAFVLYYKQGVLPHDRARVGVWTRELVDAAISAGGTHYLPYQLHATTEQFRRAYPRSDEFLALKRARDPLGRFRSGFLDKYFPPADSPGTGAGASAPRPGGSEFHAVFDDVARSDAFYRFLQNIFHLFPEDRFHRLIAEACARFETDAEIYEHVRAALPSIEPRFAALTHALPALRKQKREMGAQAARILAGRTAFDGYLEIGSTGRYVGALRRRLKLSGALWLSSEVAPGNGLADVMERGRLTRIGRFVPLDYRPVDESEIPRASLDLATCFIGLHHAPLAALDAYVRSIRRTLRPGGVLLLRDHDVRDEGMRAFVSLVHTVFNLGVGASWADDRREFRAFRSADEWSRYLAERGFRESGPRLLQQNDPSDNTLMAFAKTDEADAA